MTEFSVVIAKIRNKFSELQTLNSQLRDTISNLEQTIAQASDKVSKLALENADLLQEIEKSKTVNMEMQEGFKQEIDGLKKQLETLEMTKSSNTIDVDGIVREIDECIHLVKNNL